jgi:ferritin-like metal-binding protein YciE
MKLESLQDLYVDHLKDLYSAETQLVKALPKVEKAATSQKLKSAIHKHLTQTEEHVRRLETIFSALKTKPTGKTCKGMEGLITEADEILKEDAEPEVRDAGIIAAAQKVEHYEISGYGTARTYAQMLGQEEAAKTLQKTLDEEAQTDEDLSRLAEWHINAPAIG